MGLFFLLGAIFGGFTGSETIRFAPILDQNNYRPYSDIAGMGLFSAFFCTILFYAFAENTVRCPKCKRRTFKRVPYNGKVSFICKRCGIRIKTGSKYYEPD